MTIHRTEYTSGLRVVTERMPGVRSVSLGVWVLAGSRDEAPAISGSSHFLEHLLFKGTKSRSAQDIAQAFDAVGGDLNAFTAKEYTCYYARVLDRDLELAVDHLADMLQHSVIRSADLDGERQVILEEINMHEDSPEDLVHDVFTETLWPDHPLGRPVLGTVATIEAATRASVHRFYKRHYVPGNFVVAAAGNVRHDDVLSLLATRMETGRALPEGDDSTWNLRSAGHPPSPSGKRLVRRRKTEQAHICLGTNGLARTDPDRFAFLVVNTALGGGMSSRLFQEIRERRGLAYSVYSYHSQYTEAGLFTTYAGHDAGTCRAGDRAPPSRARGRGVRRSHRGGVRTGSRPRERVAGPRARGSGGTHVAPGQVRDRARRDPVGEPDARAGSST